MMGERHWLASLCLDALCATICYRLVPMLADLPGNWQKLP